MDNGIQQLKKAIRRLQEMKAGDWLTHLEHATSAFNKTPHGSIDAAPNNLPASVTLEQSNQAAVIAQHNSDQIDKRKEILQKKGGFRVLKDKKRGLRRRADESTWSKKVHIVASFPHPATVQDSEGQTFKTKRVLAVPLDSSAQAAAPTTIADNLRRYAVALREIVLERPDTFASAARTLRIQKPGLEAALRSASLTTTACMDMFTDLLSRSGRTISAVREVAPPRARRRLNIVM